MSNYSQVAPSAMPQLATTLTSVYLHNNPSKCDNSPASTIIYGIAAFISQVQVDSFHPNHRVKTHGTFRQTTAHAVSKCAPSTTADIPSQEGFPRFPFSTTTRLPTARRVFILFSLLFQDTATDVPCSRVTDTPPDDLAAQAHSQPFAELSSKHTTHASGFHPSRTHHSQQNPILSTPTFSTGLPVGVSISNLELLNSTQPSPPSTRTIGSPLSIST